MRAKLASLGKRSAPAVRPIRIAAVNAPQPVSASRAVRFDELEQLARQPVGLACQHAQLRDLLARDTDTGASGQPAQPPGDAVGSAGLSLAL